MTPRDGRFDDIYELLSARERARLVLQAYKSDAPPEYDIYLFMPSEQRAEFNHYVDMINVAKYALAPLLFVLEARLETLVVKRAWLETIHLWARSAGALRLNAADTKEAITASEYAVREADARGEWLPIGLCIEIMTNHHAWRDEEYVTDRKGDRDVPDRLWNRVARENRDKLKRVAADGTLASCKRDRILSIRAGSLYDHLGQPTPVYPERVFAYDVRPDDEWEEVQRLNAAQDRVFQVLARAPKPVRVPIDKSRDDRLPADYGLEVADRGLILSVRDLLLQRWVELRTIEIGAGYLADQFGGEDPLKPEERAILDDGLRLCRVLRDELSTFVTVTLLEPAEDDIEHIHTMMQHCINGTTP